MDTGLASYLIGWDNAKVLQNGVTPTMNFFFFRDKDGNEIDLLIKRNGILYPIEVKKHISCNKGDITAFKQLEKIPDIIRGEGCVICMADDVLPIAAGDRAVGVCWL